jgi:hypothetical protein
MLTIQTQEIFANLSKIPNMKAYLREDVPEEFHYSDNKRIGKLANRFLPIV